MTEKILGPNRFFSFGSQPTAPDNDTEYDIAITNIWPVLFSWHHESDSGTSSTASLRCFRTDRVAYDSRESDGVPNRGDEEDDEDKASTRSDDSSSDDSGGSNSSTTDDDDKDDAGFRAGPAALVGLVTVGLSSMFALL